MKNIKFLALALVLAASSLAAAGTAFAATPVLSVSQSGNTVTLNINNADAGVQAYLYQRQSSASFSAAMALGATLSNGSLTSTQTITFDGSSNPVLLYVTVDGLSSPTVQASPGACASSCGSGNLSLSQTSLAINSGQSTTVTAYPSSGSILVSGNSNSSAASALVSGDQVIITGINTGTTTIMVCSGASAGQCGNILVSVNGATSSGLSFSNSNPVLTLNQSQTLNIFSPGGSSGSFYISSNGSPNVVTASISGTTLFLYGNAPGSGALSVCQTGSTFCGTVSVTVGSGASGLGGISLSQSTLTLTVGQTGTVAVSNAIGSLTISNNSNSSVISAGVSGQNITVYAIAPGSSSLTVCQTGYSGCVTLYVIVSGSGTSSSGGSISFSLTNPVLTIGQSQSIAIYSSDGATNYSVSNNANSNVVSLSLSGSSLYMVGQNTGTSNITVCEINTNICGTLYVTVNGSNGGLSFNPGSVNVEQSQSVTAAVSGGSGSYYLSGNTNPSASAVSLQNGTLYITGLNSGNTSLTVCDSGNTSLCGTLLVSVGTASNTGSLSFSNSNPVLAVGQNQTITINGSGSYYISAITNSAIITVNLSGPTLNITGNSTGSGTLTVCQTGSSACGTLTVTVNATGTSGSTIYFNSPTLPAMAVGQNYDYQLQTTGGSGSYTYSLTSGSLPTGISLSPSGLLAGIPANSNSSSFTVLVSDTSGHTITANVTIVGNGTSTTSTASPYASGQLINENGTISIVYKNTKTGFANAAAFTGLGFSFSNVLTVGSSGLASSGQVVNTASAQHPWGSWILSGGTVYFIHQSGLIPVPDWNTLLNNGGRGSFLVPANSSDLLLPKLSIMTLNDTRMH